MVTKQAKFAFMVAILIIYATFKGYQVTFGDAWAKVGQGRPHRKGSFHFDRLAIDLNIHRNRKYLKKTSDHAPLGKFWKFIGGTWGGDWGDGNHYSWGEN